MAVLHIPVISTCRGYDRLALSNRNMVYHGTIGCGYWLRERYNIVFVGYSGQVI